MTTFLIILGVLALSVVSFYGYLFHIIKNENPEFWNSRVKKIEARYHGTNPQNRILFAGSSSIEYWETLEKDMEPLQVLNHGIGGTKVADVIFYADRLIYPFNPRAIVFFAGTNDINGFKNSSKSGEEVFRLTVDFFSQVRAKFPAIPIFYIAIFPCPAKIKVWKDAEEANRLIKEYCTTHNNFYFINPNADLLDVNGKLRKDIFRFDKVHFNKEGYRIWAKAVKPELMRIIKI
jgi:lysophospholipase L1-like esterase